MNITAISFVGDYPYIFNARKGDNSNKFELVSVDNTYSAFAGQRINIECTRTLKEAIALFKTGGYYIRLTLLASENHTGKQYVRQFSQHQCRITK